MKLRGGKLTINDKIQIILVSLCLLVMAGPIASQDSGGRDSAVHPSPAEDTAKDSTGFHPETEKNPEATEKNPEELILIDEGSAQETTQAPVISTWDFVKMLLVLGGVVGLIYFLFVLLKRGARNRYPENQLIRMLDYQSLSGSRALHLVEVGNSIFLVGSAENGVSLISEITDKEGLDTIHLELSQKPAPQRRNFSDMLINLFKSAGDKRISMFDSINFMKQQKDRLRKLR